jgi:hypothetical protein
VNDRFQAEILRVFENAYMELGPGSARLEKRPISEPGSDPRFLVALEPTNPRSAPIAAAIIGDVNLSVGRRGCSVELWDIIQPADGEAAIETTRDLLREVIDGRYHEKLQSLPLIGVVAAQGYLRIRGKPVTFGHGIFVPLLVTATEQYEPYRPPGGINATKPAAG